MPLQPEESCSFSNLPSISEFYRTRKSWLKYLASATAGTLSAIAISTLSGCKEGIKNAGSVQPPNSGNRPIETKLAGTPPPVEPAQQTNTTDCTKPVDAVRPVAPMGGIAPPVEPPSRPDGRLDGEMALPSPPDKSSLDFNSIPNSDNKDSILRPPAHLPGEQPPHPMAKPDDAPSPQITPAPNSPTTPKTDNHSTTNDF
jgi:hypothetical protein